MINIIEIKTTEHVDRVRDLFREYEEYLDVDICFQDFEQELKDLPGPYAPPDGCLLLAMEGNKEVGCVAVRPLRDDICEMKRLFVRPEYHGRGYGRLLVEEIIRRAENIGYRTMRLDTLTRLKQAMRLYESFGFREIEPYYDNPMTDVVYWELEIGGHGKGEV
ncbi:MAG: GNAT family N-acetyltransferase [Chlorobi bacterium]|nr:GNAT family N-acetyltransferase [Chlorobiota bacterium]